MYNCYHPGVEMGDRPTNRCPRLPSLTEEEKTPKQNKNISQIYSSWVTPQYLQMQQHLFFSSYVPFVEPKSIILKSILTFPRCPSFGPPLPVVSVLAAPSNSMVKLSLPPDRRHKLNTPLLNLLSAHTLQKGVQVKCDHSLSFTQQHCHFSAYRRHGSPWQ